MLKFEKENVQHGKVPDGKAHMDTLSHTCVLVPRYVQERQKKGWLQKNLPVSNTKQVLKEGGKINFLELANCSILK
ncbi:hypothetical protein POVCU2_0068990 [Plasmodium ovale curtisi]|uniref:Uncharacterized protein n=1 Tax=Plasmodium ovale curtisi TaxID=864141 RepID=A0A1A8VVV7_PLAOA|nr:hypothetical protein POVCU1_008940 [Plasmodium ovale curtisi]SBS91649.1 hypothetical protein POVCU2_0068990 [Plasmodium ovale curtisi]